MTEFPKTRLIRYRNARVRVVETRTRQCLINHPVTKTDEHHWKKIYSVKEVRLDPPKALAYTEEACMYHHKILNALTNLYEFASKHPEDFTLILKVMPTEMYDLLASFFKASTQGTTAE